MRETFFLVVETIQHGIPILQQIVDFTLVVIAERDNGGLAFTGLLLDVVHVLQLMAVADVTSADVNMPSGVLYATLRVEEIKIFVATLNLRSRVYGK